MKIDDSKFPLRRVKRVRKATLQSKEQGVGYLLTLSCGHQVGLKLGVKPTMAEVKCKQCAEAENADA